MRWIVQKFGGTSVGKFPENISNQIVRHYQKTHRVAVVCSARSIGTKATGTTTRLIKAAEYALKADTDFTVTIEEIRKDHVDAATARIKDEVVLAELIRDIDSECDMLERLLAASQVIDEISARTMDSILAVGERLSCVFMTALMRADGLKAQYVDLSRLIGPSEAARFKDGLDKDYYRLLTAKIVDEIQACADDCIPVITGFFGVVPKGLLSAVGRGYTDLCSALVAVGLAADELQIWKEVDGIFTADPRKVPTARLLDRITPEEAAELTYYGSEVIHPFTMEQVISARIPIRIKNVMNPLGDGTVIFPDDNSRPGDETPVHPPRVLTPTTFLARPKQATAVTTKPNILVLNIHSNRKNQSHGFLAKVFGILDRWKLAVDLISTSEVHVSMALHSTMSELSLKDAIAELSLYGQVDVTRKLCLVSLVGKQMKQLVGIAGDMFSTLAEAGINIEMISQGASEINISCVIEDKDALKALNMLHQRLLCRVSEVPVLTH